VRAMGATGVAVVGGLNFGVKHGIWGNGIQPQLRPGRVG
jgi:hypothetical protein